MTLGLRPQPIRQTAAPVRRSGPPTFVFGIGSAKSGTTWLYRYLRAHRDCHLRGHKELNYFDAIDKAEVRFQAERLAAEIRELEARLPGMAPDKRAQRFADMLDMRDFHRVLLTCHADPNAYFRYMMGGLGLQRLVADITPNYAGLSVDMLGKMVGVATETRFIYLMRDPVARFWSNVRMDASMKVPAGSEAAFSGLARAELAQAMSDPASAILAHSNYALVLDKMDAAIPADRRLVMFYEDLLSQDGVRQLCRFLGIKPMKVDFGLRANEGLSAEMTADDRAALRRLLRPQYEAVASRFPVLPKAWQKTMAEGFA